MKYKIIITTKKNNRKDIMVNSKGSCAKYSKFNPIIVPVPGASEKIKYRSFEELKVIPYKPIKNRLIKHNSVVRISDIYINLMYEAGYRYKDISSKEFISKDELIKRFRKSKTN